MLRCISCWMLLLVSSIGFVGCTGTEVEDAVGAATTEDGDEHAHPETFVEAVASLVDQQTAIKDAFTSGKPDEAHAPLHEIGHTLESLPELAEKAGIEGEALDAISAAKDKLFDSFMKLDDMMHGGEEITYDDVAADIEAGMTEVSSKLTGK